MDTADEEHVHHMNDQQDITTEMDKRYGQRTSSYNLRPWKERDYSHLHNMSLTVKPCDHKHGHTVLEHIVMTQHGLKAGLREFGEAGTEAVLKELQQLHDADVIEPIKSESMTSEEKKGALHYLKRSRVADVSMVANSDYTQQRRSQAHQQLRLSL